MSLPPFQVLLDAHGGDVHRFLVAIVGHVDADDCYQETWLSALRAYPRLTDPTRLRSWILTIAHHKAIDHIRARRRAPIPSDELPEPADPLALPSDRDEEVFAHVRSLPDKQRTAVGLRFAADLAYAEIGEVMGTSVDAARRNVHEALKRLRKEYQP